MSATLRRRAPFSLLLLVAAFSAGGVFGGGAGPWLEDPADAVLACPAAHTGPTVSPDRCTIGQAVGTPARSAATPRADDLTVLQSGGVVDPAVGSSATAWCEPDQRIEGGGYWLEQDFGLTPPATPGAIAAVVTASRPVSALGADGQLLRQGWEVIVVGATGTRFTVYALCLGRELAPADAGLAASSRPRVGASRQPSRLEPHRDCHRPPERTVAKAVEPGTS